MGDFSITARPIVDLIAGDCWARRELHCGTKYGLWREFPIELEGSRDRMKPSNTFLCLSVSL